MLLVWHPKGRGLAIVGVAHPLQPQAFSVKQITGDSDLSCLPCEVCLRCSVVEGCILSPRHWAEDRSTKVALEAEVKYGPAPLLFCPLTTVGERPSPATGRKT